MSAARVVRPEKPQKASSATVKVELDHEEQKEEEGEGEEEEEPFFIKEDNDEDDEDFCGGGVAVAEVDPGSTARPRDVFSRGVQYSNRCRYTLRTRAPNSLKPPPNSQGFIPYCLCTVQVVWH